MKTKLDEMKRIENEIERCHSLKKKIEEETNELKKEQDLMRRSQFVPLSVPIPIPVPVYSNFQLPFHQSHFTPHQPMLQLPTHIPHPHTNSYY